jgi:hypothetical protein
MACSSPEVKMANPYPGYFIEKPAKPWQTIVAQASQPAVSLVSKPACRGFSTTHPNWLAPSFHAVIHVSVRRAMKYPG